MKTKMALLLASLLYFCLAPNLFSQAPIIETTTDPFGNEVVVVRDSLTGVAGRIWYSNPNLGMFAETIRTLRGADINEQLLRRYAPRVLKSYKDILRVNPQEFRLVRAEGDGEFWYVSFDQVHKGVPVFNGRFGFTLNQNGDIISIGSDSYPGINISPQPGLSSEEAVTFARKQLPPETVDSLVVVTDVKLMIYPERTKLSVLPYLVYQVEIDDYQHGERMRYFVDAHSGAIVASQQLWRDGSWTVSGTITGVMWPKNSDFSSQTVPPQTLNLVRVTNVLGQQVATDQIDTNGYYSMSGNHAYQTFYVTVELAGSWALINNPNNLVQETQSFVSSGSHVRDFNFTDTFDGFNAYYHMNEVHDFFKGSPFNYSGMDYQMEGWVNDNTVPNARAYGTRISYSSNSGRRWWESSDVVYHEYTHNVVYDIYGDFIGNITSGLEADAMDEGIADYFAASLNQDSDIDWVGRDVDNSLSMPLDFGESAHWNGQILSGAMWDLESTTSLNTARRLNFKAMRITPRPDTYVEFVDNVILADDNNGKLCDGTPNYSAIIQAFQTNHGIVPTLNVGIMTVTINGPDVVEPNQSNTWTADVCGGSGSISYQWYVKYEGSSTWNSLGTGQSQSHTFFQNYTWNELKVEVNRGSQYAEDIFWVYVTDGGFFKTGAKLTELPNDFELQQNYPNPFNPMTEIKYALPENGHTKLEIFNMRGQRVRTLVNQQKSAGYHKVVWDSRDDFGKNVASGVYLYRIHVLPNQAGAFPFESIKKMTLLR